MAKKQKYRFVKIDWLDINSDSSWAEPSDILEDVPSKCVSVGWLLLNNKEKTIVAASRSEDGDYGDRTVFPSCVIKKITSLSEES